MPGRPAIQRSSQTRLLFNLPALFVSRDSINKFRARREWKDEREKERQVSAMNRVWKREIGNTRMGRLISAPCVRLTLCLILAFLRQGGPRKCRFKAGEDFSHKLAAVAKRSIHCHFPETKPGMERAISDLGENRLSPIQFYLSS